MLVRFVVSPRLALVELLQEVWDLAGLFLSSSPSAPMVFGGGPSGEFMTEVSLQTIQPVAMGAAVKDAADNSRVYDTQRWV
jgi:hypothetical protein